MEFASVDIEVVIVRSAAHRTSHEHADDDRADSEAS